MGFDVAAFRKRATYQVQTEGVKAFYAWLEKMAFKGIMQRLHTMDAYSGEIGFDLDARFSDLVADHFVFQPYASEAIRAKLIAMGFTGATINFECDTANEWVSVFFCVA